jgi:ribosome-binding protein aMBF1 (putative translation factor)
MPHFKSWRRAHGGRAEFEDIGMEPPTAQRIELTPLTVENTSSIDRHVGASVRMRRLSMGIKHDALAAMVGATVHDLQKYEMGECRIDAKRLLQISLVLGVPASFFFDGLTATRTNEQ